MFFEPVSVVASRQWRRKQFGPGQIPMRAISLVPALSLVLYD